MNAAQSIRRRVYRAQLAAFMECRSEMLKTLVTAAHDTGGTKPEILRFAMFVVAQHIAETPIFRPEVARAITDLIEQNVQDLLDSQAAGEILANRPAEGHG